MVLESHSGHSTWLVMLYHLRSLPSLGHHCVSCVQVTAKLDGFSQQYSEASQNHYTYPNFTDTDASCERGSFDHRDVSGPTGFICCSLALCGTCLLACQDGPSTALVSGWDTIHREWVTVQYPHGSFLHFPSFLLLSGYLFSLVPCFLT